MSTDLTLVLDDGEGNRETHQLPGPGGTIRVAAGRPGRRSAVWRIWANRRGGDVYIAAREVAGVQKISLHESGDWRIQWTSSDAGARWAAATGSRVNDQWRRPSEASPGLTKGVSIYVPHGHVVDLAGDEQADEGVFWMPEPRPGRVLGLHVLVLRPIEGLGAMAGAFPVAGFGLSNGEAVLLAASMADMSYERQREIDAYHKTARAIVSTSELLLANRSTLRMTLFGRSNIDGERILWDLTAEPEEEIAVNPS